MHAPAALGAASIDKDAKEGQTLISKSRRAVVGERAYIQLSAFSLNGAAASISALPAENLWRQRQWPRDYKLSSLSPAGDPLVRALAFLKAFVSRSLALAQQLFLWGGKKQFLGRERERKCD